MKIKFRDFKPLPSELRDLTFKERKELRDYCRKKFMLAYQIEWLKKRRQSWFKKNGLCKRCGSSRYLELDRVNPEAKVTHRIWSYRKKIRDSTLKHYQILCKRCHKKKTAKELSKKYKDKPQFHARTIPDWKYKKVRNLIKSGLSERASCRKVGITRGAYGSARRFKYRIFAKGYKS